MTATAAAWQALQSEARGEPGWHLRRIYGTAPCEISAGLHQPGNVQGLIIEAPAEALPFDVELPRSRGFELDVQLIGPSHGGVVRFTLVLTNPVYQSVFSVLCDNIAETAAAAATARGALRDWARQLHVWQEFLARYGAEGLSTEAALGLYGELIILRDELISILGLDAAVLSWAGPRGEPNDFEFAGGYLEVKATARQAPESLQIANLDQLDDERGYIMLANVRLRSDPAGLTLPGLVAALRAALLEHRSGALSEFEGRLIAAGYLDAHALLYPVAWTLSRIDFYRVKDAFPRLTRRDVRAGVRDCSYSIALVDCAPFLISKDELTRMARNNG